MYHERGTSPHDDEGNQFLRLAALTQACRGIRRIGPDSCDVTGIADDSREVLPGFLFASLRGTRTDGDKFIGEAVARGACAILRADEGQDRPCALPAVLSRNPRQTLAEIARAFYGNPSGKLKVLGVTGTNGKTTTTYLLKQLLQAHGQKAGWIGTVGYDLGETVLPPSHTTPGSIRLQHLLAQMNRQGLSAASMEVSSHALDQSRVHGVDFDGAIFTNLTRDHLDYHGTWDAYLRSKLRLFELLNDSPKPSRHALANADDPAFENFRRAAKVPFLSYGIARPADVRATDLRLGDTGSSFTLHSPMGKVAVSTRLLGRFNVSNALAAAAAGTALGLDLNCIARTLAVAQAPVGRMEFLGEKEPFRVVVDYAHTDDALRNVLSTVREFTAGRVLVVFGCGGDRDRTKRPLMGRVAQDSADFSYLTSDNPRSEDPRAIIREIEAGFTRRDVYTVCEDRAAAIAMALEAALPGDLIVLAGKGHEQVQVLKDGPVPYSDRDTVRELLQRGARAACHK